MAIAFLNNITFSGGAQAEKLRLENLGSNPASGNEGQLYFNTATDKVLVYANGQWTNLDGANDFLIGLSFNTGDGVLTATIANQSDVTVDLDGRYALSSSIPGTIVESVTAGTYLTNSGTAADVVIDHDNTSRTNNSNSVSPAYGTSFTVIDTVNTNTTGHVTVVNTKTVTLPAAEDYEWTAAADAGSNRIIQKGNTIDFTGGTNINTENAGGETRFHLDDSITLAGTLTVNGTGQSSFAGQVTVPATPSANTDAASKQYVLSQVGGVGGFQGGYNATTNTPALTGASNVALNQGDFYVVTVAGTFFTENVEVGDFIFANSNIAANSSPSLSDYTVVIADQNVAGEGATDGATQKGVAGFNSAHFNVTANGFVSSDIYAGGSTLGIVPAGGAGTTFLRGDGTWVTPTDTNTQRAAGTGLSLLGNTINANVDGTQSVAANTSSSTAFRTYKVQVDSGDNLVVNVPWVDTNTQTVTSVDEVAAGTSTGTPIVVNPTTGDVKIQSMAYDGGSDVGHVPAGGSSSTFLRGDGSWAVPVDTGALGDRVALTSGNQSGGLTTFTYAVTNSFGAAAVALDVKCEVISAAGETVYASVTRSGANLIVEFTGNIADSAYEVLLTYVG